MYFYFFIFAILAIMALISHGRNARDQRYLGLLSAIIIVCFQGFRWRTGTDWDPYFDCFRFSDSYQVEYVEWGYYMFNKTIKAFTDSYTVFLLIQCSLIAYCYTKTSRFFNVNNVSLVLLYFFACTPFPIRYTMAVAIFMMSYKYIVERKFVKFCIFYALAAMCHQIVLLVLPFYFFCQKSLSTKIYLGIYFTCCAVGLTSEYIFKNLLQAANLIFNYLPEFSQTKMNAYMVESEEERTLVSTMISFLNGAFFIFTFTKVRDKHFADDNKYVVLLNLYVYGLCLGRLVIGAIPYLARVIACFSGGFVLMLYLGICSIKNRKSPYFRLLLQVVLLLLFFIYSAIIYNTSLVQFEPVFVPYYSIFSSTTRPVVF